MRAYYPSARSDDAAAAGWGIPSQSKVPKGATLTRPCVRRTKPLEPGGPCPSPWFRGAPRDWPKPVVAHVERAASVDTLVLMAAGEATIVEGGALLVHPPRVDVIGQLSAIELRRQAEALDEFQEALLDAYQRRTGLPRQELRELMARDQWMTAERAVELRFCDRLVPRPRAADECPALHCARLRASTSGN